MNAANVFDNVKEWVSATPPAAATRDIQSLVKTKPEVALTGAVILGFIAGRLFSSR
jgi:hypothetical protein